MTIRTVLRSWVSAVLLVLATAPMLAGEFQRSETIRAWRSEGSRVSVDTGSGGVHTSGITTGRLSIDTGSGGIRIK